MQSLAQLADVGYITQRLLDESMAAFQAQSGAVFLQQGDSLSLTQTAGAWNGNPVISLRLEHAGTRLGQLSLGPRHKERDYSPQDHKTLLQIATAAAQALAIPSRMR